MREIIKNGHDFRIIPENFESATIFEIKNIGNDDFEIELTRACDEELKDYGAGTNVEIFGSGSQGLIFFETKIKEQSGKILRVILPQNYKNIQRREYSRVKFMGEIDIEGQNDNIVSIEDISAGGMKIITKQPFEAAKNYKVTAAENKNTVIFLHKVMRGGTNKSFGIEVARLAGLPKPVTGRAKALSKQLEKSPLKLEEETDDVNLITISENNALKDKLSSIDMDVMTPMQAFTTLNELVDAAKKM